MRTSLECLPCFLRQALSVARLSTHDGRLQKEIMAETLRLLAGMDLTISPPENAVAIYNAAAELADVPDPFASIKKASNSFAAAMLPELRQILQKAPNPFPVAVQLAIAGNVIDYGSQKHFDINGTIEKFLQEQPWPCTFQQFEDDVNQADNILYLADNCGELVFDGLFVELLKKRGKKVTLAVKEGPIINDALYEDAIQCGLDRFCDIQSNGTSCPGTPLANCSEKFQKMFYNADLIISKGQGNYETLSENALPIYFLLTVKCSVVAGHISKHIERGPGEKKIPQPGAMIVIKNHFNESS